MHAMLTLSSALGSHLPFTIYMLSGMLCPRGQRGFEAKIFGLGLVTSGLVLILMQCLASFS